MTVTIVAGPPLSASALHCAGVGHWAFADDIRLNAEHWKAAAEGKPGYRLPDKPASPPTEMSAAAAELDAARATTTAVRPDLEIPSDLSIPSLLRCTR
jgi:hypothetical protein